MAGEDLETLAREGKIEKKPFPGFQTPMLATLTKHFFDDPQWIYERKLDGIRCVILIKDGKASLFSRNENLLKPQFSDLAAQVPKITRQNLVADGVLVSFDGKTTSFRKLQQCRQVTGTDVLSKTDTSSQFTEPKGGRIGFGALLVGFYEKDELKFAGKLAPAIQMIF